jgi:hypothetical protein
MYENIELIAEEMSRRKSAQDPLLQRMIEIRDRYNGDVVTPVPEIEKDIPLHNLAPLIIANAVDHTALHAAQVMPSVSVPSLNPARSSGSRSTDYADRRRKSLGTVWDQSWVELLLGRMYRHLAGYATSALWVELDYERRMPFVRIRDPLGAYPEPKAPEDLSLPIDNGFITAKSLDWIHYNYPWTRDKLKKGDGFATTHNDDGELWDVVEWLDEEKTVVGVLGPRDSYHSWTTEPGRWALELSRTPHPLGRCQAVMPRRVTLDRIISQLANLVGHADLIAKLQLLDIQATEKSIFPDTYVISKTGQSPSLLHGEWKGGETGEVNIILDADAVGQLRATPDPNNKMSMDRVERNALISSGMVPQQGGETYGALRTGRGIDALMGAALDPRTVELHLIGERYLTEINELVLLAFRKRWPTRTYAVSWPGDDQELDFTPGKHIEDTKTGLNVRNRVFYPIPGMDATNATQIIAQALGAGLISEKDARRMHPFVKNPEGTERQRTVEGFERLAITSLEVRAQQGIPPEDIGRMVELAYEGKRIHEIIAQVNREASERQAATPPEMPGQAPAPEQMPGLANPGEGAEMGGPQVIQEPGANLDALKRLVGALQQPA